MDQNMPQCTAKSKRSGRQCLRWAVCGRGTCRMHGGTLREPITKEGKERSRRATLRRGAHAKPAKAQQQIMSLIRESKDLLRRL